MKDRVSKYPNRKLITYSDGSSELVTIERADEPTEEGSLLNKEFMLQDSTALTLKLSGDQATINNALMALYNAVKESSGGGGGLSIVDLEKDVTGVLPVKNGGTGVSSYTSGAALVATSANTLGFRQITNNMNTEAAITGSDNITTMNTLRYAINRTTSVVAADGNYTSSMARGISLHTSEPSSITNGSIAAVYE